MHKVEAKECQRLYGERDRKSNLVPNKISRKVATYYVVKKAFAIQGDSSSESYEYKCPKDTSMLIVKDNENVFDGIFTFIEKLNDQKY